MPEAESTTRMARKDGPRVADTPTVWQRIFDHQGLVFHDPHEDLAGLIDLLHERQAHSVLDLGCGTGRHVLALAGAGFDVTGLDSAPNALSITRDRLEAAELTAELSQHDIFAPLPFPDASFDGIVSTQVIHHARIAAIRALVAEIERVLNPGGLLFVTVPRLQNQGTRFEQLEPGTFVPLDGREAGLPHHYFTPAELRGLFANFTEIDLHVDQVDHYCLTMQYGS